MLMPKKVRDRKQQRGRMAGKAWRGSDVSFGDYGLKALEPCWLTDRQIEAARVAMTRFIKRGGKIWIRVFPDKPITKKPQETRMGKGKGAPEAVGLRRPAGPHPVRDGRGQRDRGARRDASGGREAPDQDQVRDPVRGGEGVMKVAEFRDLAVDELQQRVKDLDDQLFRLRIQKSMGQVEAAQKSKTLRRDLARVKTVLREKETRVMATKAEITGVVVSDKMDKTVKVAVERQIRDHLYGKTQRRTSKFLAHNETNDAKIGDRVAIVESRPLSRRKRWVVTRVVEKAKEI